MSIPGIVLNISATESCCLLSQSSLDIRYTQGDESDKGYSVFFSTIIIGSKESELPNTHWLLEIIKKNCKTEVRETRLLICLLITNYQLKTSLSLIQKGLGNTMGITLPFHPDISIPLIKCGASFILYIIQPLFRKTMKEIWKHNFLFPYPFIFLQKIDP